jgi:hypothetical protein
MNAFGRNSNVGAPASAEFEETLRLVARLAPPEGLEQRVQAALHAAPVSGGAQILAWPVALRLDAAWMRSAAAAAIVAVVIGGSWGVYSRVQSIQPMRAITVPLHLSTQGGFSSAGAMRTPQTLNGPIMEHQVVTHPMVAAPQPGKPAVKPSLKTPLRPDKTAATGNAVPQPATPAK